MTAANTTHWVLTLVCEDKPGIVHAISGAIVAANGNITESSQFASDDTGRFFMRLQIESAVPREHFENQIAPVAERYGMTWELEEVGRKMKTLILVSKSAHCLNDLLFRQRGGQLPVEIPAVFGNHPELKEMADFYGIPFEHHPISSDADKGAFEQMLRDFIKSAGVELIVLARYMQVLSPEFCAEFEGRIINIHHSFLPGFKGANPYAQAHARGVKLIGATAHFVTADLDEGPIIEQNVVRVEHSDSKKRLVSIGQDVESKTLTQAVRWFAERRVLQDGDRTIIFS
ncbi:formyltetrahydrofolate deformylase [Rhodoluna sp. KAS3]|uniref:formyltetrahydrofolate deformylase n=1 Tax=Rhodoluna sp. KAS3 TaxID=942880 RepID=UPI0022314BEB|nr:formyltetrahydrofolate deformylase [Rhodoluna sp. KAS3]BDS48628.1 formyltetrahydrofolate deformylase [Rhodoluna sp. KAS3]